MSAKSIYIPRPKHPVYEPSIISQVCFTKVDDMVKFHSDVHVILREKSLADKLGPEQLRAYVDDMLRNRNMGSTEQLTDDQLMETIQSRRLTELTDVYQLNKYLSDQADDIKSKIDKYNKQKEKSSAERKKLLDSLGIEDKESK